LPLPSLLSGRQQCPSRPETDTGRQLFSVTVAPFLLYPHGKSQPIQFTAFPVFFFPTDKTAHEQAALPIKAHGMPSHFHPSPDFLRQEYRRVRSFSVNLQAEIKFTYYLSELFAFPLQQATEGGRYFHAFNKTE
jgi:hypothetical protein